MSKENLNKYSSNLAGHLLVATPQMSDPRFKKSAILMCQHDKNSAMGLVINQPTSNFKFSEFVDKLGITVPIKNKQTEIYVGGPVDPQRGYILHTSDQISDDTFEVCDNVCLSIQIEMIKKIGLGNGPKYSKILLGYAGWSSGQLEYEIRQNMWFNFPANSEIIFLSKNDEIWEGSFSKFGISASSFSSQIGNA